MPFDDDVDEILPIKADEKTFRDPILIHKNKIYKKVPFKRETDMFHNLNRYRRLLNRIFGDESIILPMEKVIGVNNKVITDGLLLRIKEGGIELWIIEVEMLRHGVQSHIREQLNKINNAVEEINPWNLAANIYNELRRDRYKFNKIRERVLGNRKDSDDLIPEIKKAVDNSSRNILLIIDGVNSELIEAIEEIKKNNRNIEVVVMQLYIDIDRSPSDIENEVLLITPMKGTEVDRKRLDVKSYTKRRMDRYWNSTLKIIRSLGNEVRRREYKKTKYIVAYTDGKPFLLMRKMRKRGGIEIWINEDILTDEIRKEFQIPNRIVLTGRGKMYKRILGEYVWAKAYKFSSDEVSLDSLKNMLYRIFNYDDSQIQAPQDSDKPHQHAQQHEHSSTPSL